MTLKYALKKLKYLWAGLSERRPHPIHKRKKVALLFGSFNPIHEGHLAILNHIAQNHPDIEIRLIVSPQNPFKADQGMLATARTRLDEATGVIEKCGLPVKVSDVEFHLPIPLYTINTLRHLRATEPDKDFILVMGGDNIDTIETWHKGRDILREFEIWVYPREGCDVEKACQKLNSTAGVRKVVLLDAPLCNISSTEIRNRARESASGEFKEFDVIVIGGGITGAGVTRDCSMRGLKTLLLEKSDLTNGASGRNHGLLHSGARYAVQDEGSAAECIRENQILKRIAPHCIDDTEGLFVTLPEDDLGYQKTFIEACRKAGINAEAIDPQEALRMVPAVNPTITGAVKVPDAAVDPFSLTLSNAIDAQSYGACIKTDCEVISFIRDGNRIAGVTVINKSNHQIERYYANVTVNAAGIWGMAIAEMAGVTINMFPSKGAMLVFGHNLSKMVINRCRKPSDADIVVPGHNVSIVGTTSERISYDEIDRVTVSPDEADLLISQGSRLLPVLFQSKILRVYAGVRPLVALDDDPEGRQISREMVLLDHEKRDGVRGLITICGGKLTTYRLMAEKATDMVCRKLGSDATCVTDKIVLPSPVPETSHCSGKIVCSCEGVTDADINHAVRELGARNLSDVRRWTRLGMGSCQGQICARKAAELLEKPELEEFVNERWKGIYPVAWADAMRDAQLAQWTYKKNR